MKKKKLLVPLAVMTLSCGLCAGLLTGCGEHEHDYTKWDHDDTGHWQICVEDGETTDKEPHSWGEDDRCECGAEKPAYGTASGSVKLLKMGEEVNEFAGVTIDPGEDDGIEIDYDSTTGAFSISNARVGKTYKLAISKDGYLTTYVNFQAVKNQNAALGNCTLSYDAFSHGSHIGSDWSGDYGTPAKIDKTHVNDKENPYFKIGEGTGDFYVYSKEEYDTVTASVTYKRGDTNDIDVLDDKGNPAPGNQGLRLVFDDGKAVMIRIEKMSDGDFKAQWIGSPDKKDWEEAPINDTWDFTTEERDESKFKPFSDTLAKQYAETGVELKLVRNGGVVRAYVNEQFAGEQILGAKYAGQKCRVALAAARVKGGAEIPFSITKEIPATETEKFESALTFDKSKLPEGVTATLDKESGYKRGDLVTLTLDADTEKYVVKELKLGETSLLENYADGKVSFILTEATNTLTLTLEEIKKVNLTDVSVTGKKYDVKGNSIADNTVIILKGQGGLKDVEITVQDGKFTKENVVQGTYTAELAGYKPVTVEIGENEIKGGGITFEYDGFESMYYGWDWEKVVLDNANAGEFGYNGQQGTTFSVKTKAFYNDVAASLVFKKSNSTNGDQYLQGIQFEFEDGKIAMFGINLNEGKVQFRPSPWNEKGAKDSVWGRPNDKDFWVEIYLTDAEKQAFQAEDTKDTEGGLPITLVRKDGKLYVLIQQGSKGTVRCANVTELPAAYASAKAQVGFYAADGAANAKFKYNITTELPSLTSTVQIDKNLPQNAEGITISADQEAYTLGDTVTLTVTLPEKGYVIKALTVNGESMLDKLSDGTLTFVATKAANEVSVTVEEVKCANVEATVTGKKYDVKGNTIVDDTEIILKGQGGLEDITLMVTDGKITKNDVPQGTYTAELNGITGYKPVEVTVGASGIADPIVFEYDDAFELVTNWNTAKNLDQQNDGYLKAANEMESLLTKALYKDVAFTVYLSGEYTGKDPVERIDQENQGIAFRFDGGGYVLLRMQKKNEGNVKKIQFAKPDEWWQGSGAADGADWNDLIFFNDNDEYMTAYKAGTLKLTLVREGNVFYAFLNDKYIGRQIVNEKYKDVGAQVGIYWTGTTNGAEKAWKFEMSETLPELSTSVTDGTTDMNGTVSISNETPKYGDTVTITLTPVDGYGIKSLTIGENTVTGPFKYGDGKVGTYSFTVTAATTKIVAEFETMTYANVGVGISGQKGTETIDLNGAKATLSNDKAIYEITVADGKLTRSDVLPETYTLTVEGYVSQTVTVTAESGIADAIVLAYNIFTSEPDSADLSGINAGKVTATGKGGVDLETKEKYTKVTAEAHFDVPDYTSRRYGIALVFNDGKDFRVDFAVQDQGNNILQETRFNNENSILSWNTVHTYTETEIKNTFMKDGLTYKLERDGATVKLYINGELMKTYTLDAAYADQEAKLKFIFDSNGTDSTKGFTFNITVPEAGGEQA